MRILIAEDEPRVAGAIARGLRARGAAVDIALDGAQALFNARVYFYDVVLLDRDLPKVHGDDVCRTLRDEQPALKILMLTAARSTDDVVEGTRASTRSPTPCHDGDEAETQARRARRHRDHPRRGLRFGAGTIAGPWHRAGTSGSADSSA
jgi:CheY-like chemotaxis protein